MAVRRRAGVELCTAFHLQRGGSGDCDAARQRPLGIDGVQLPAPAHPDRPRRVAPGATNLLQLVYEYGATAAVNNGNVTKQTITVPTVGQTPGFTAVQDYTYDR
jgi:hypothetical protein